MNMQPAKTNYSCRYISDNQTRRLGQGRSDYLRTMAMTNVIEATVFIMEVTKVGDVYFKLEKYMFIVKLPLHTCVFLLL